MASKVLLRRRAAAPLMATALVGASLIPSVALAESPEENRSRKPIYDDYEAATPLPTVTTPKPSPFSDTIPRISEPEVITRPHGPTPTDRLAEQIGKARLFLYQQATTAEDAVNAAMDRAFHLEKSFTSTVASLAPPARERRKADAGSRLRPCGRHGRQHYDAQPQHRLPRRFAASPRCRRRMGRHPRHHGQRKRPALDLRAALPVVAQAHLQARESAKRSWQAAKIHSDLSKRYVDDKVMTARDTVEDWVKKGK
ncbi:mitochondrial protein [Apiospora saccharicola]